MVGNPRNHSARRPLRHVAVDFLLAPLAPAAVLALSEPPTVDRMFYFIFAALAGGYLPALAFGLPLYPLVRGVLWRLRWAISFGATVAALPWLLAMAFLGRADLMANTQIAFSHGLAVSLHSGEGPALIVAAAMLGALAGLIFWIVTATEIGELLDFDDAGQRPLQPS
ncbi:hypothetical protein L2U69_01005 [Zavarzinia compransoris]|uniref:hypothetical protein n=1 Tax=Zavarzinia marina TaxID=2911065 RepID=UPI001F3DAD2D|nr:hypothetical protein [Zavarzinia marina]MCF4164221.1 hypothetical protein [Zavarzinia marina]